MDNNIQKYTKEKQIGPEKLFLARKNVIGSNFAIHFHDYFELEIVAEGKGVMTLNGNDISFGTGTVFFITPHDFHSYKNCENAVVYNISFREDAVFGNNTNNKILEKTESVFTVTKKLLSSLILLCRLMMELDGESPKSEAHLLKAIFEILPPFYEVKRSHSYTRNATAYIENHFKEKLIADDVAKHCNINVDYLNKLFKTELNATVTNYIRQIRIEYADALLENTDLSVAQIAFNCGFQSIQTFNRIYKKQHGFPPTKIKKTK